MGDAAGSARQLSAGRGADAHGRARAGARADVNATPLTGVDVNAALVRLNGQHDLLVRLLRVFAQEHGETTGRHRGRRSRAGTSTARCAIVHNLKGVAGTLSATAVFEAARALESGLRDGQRVSLPAMVDRLGKALDVVCRSVSEWSGGARSAHADEARHEPDRPLAASLLGELDALLKNRRFSARPRFEQLKEQLALPELAPMIDQVQRCLDRLEFQQARDLLPSIASALGVPFPARTTRITMQPTRHTILLVDDAAANLEALNAVLGADYELIFATSGQEAIDLAREQLPDLILLDVMMSGMNGYQVCRKLKDDDQTRGIPVIFVTSMDHEEDEAAGLDAGAIDYLAKPIRASIVKARVRNHLELKRARDLLESLSITDTLTGLANRRQFDAVLEAETRRAIRSMSHVGLLMCDLDHFKAYNDYYGHPAGDWCLPRSARCFATSSGAPATWRRATAARSSR